MEAVEGGRQTRQTIDKIIPTRWIQLRVQKGLLSLSLTHQPQLASLHWI